MDHAVVVQVNVAESATILIADQADAGIDFEVAADAPVNAQLLATLDAGTSVIDFLGQDSVEPLRTHRVAAGHPVGHHPDARMLRPGPRLCPRRRVRLGRPGFRREEPPGQILTLRRRRRVGPGDLAFRQIDAPDDRAGPVVSAVLPDLRLHERRPASGDGVVKGPAQRHGPQDRSREVRRYVVRERAQRRQDGGDADLRERLDEGRSRARRREALGQPGLACPEDDVQGDDLAGLRRLADAGGEVLGR